MTENKKTQLSEGKTEAPKAINKKVVDSDKIITHGQTESPQAVIRPTKPKENK